MTLLGWRSNSATYPIDKSGYVECSLHSRPWPGTPFIRMCASTVVANDASASSHYGITGQFAESWTMLWTDWGCMSRRGCEDFSMAMTARHHRQHGQQNGQARKIFPKVRGRTSAVG